MLPETIRNVCAVATDFSVNTTKNVYTFSCSASWIFFTSSMILFAPVLFETERAQMEELQRSQQKQASHGSNRLAVYATNNTLGLRRCFSVQVRPLQRAALPGCPHCHQFPDRFATSVVGSGRKKSAPKSNGEQRTVDKILCILYILD